MSWAQVLFCVLMTAVVVLFVAHLLSGLSLGCQEDEVVAWDGDRHTVCVNIDELAEHYASF